MKKKLLALFIIPLLAVGVLFGCKKDSVASLQESRDLYVEMIDTYISKDAEDKVVNTLFRANKLKYDSTNETTQEAKENILYVTFGDASTKASTEMKNLYTHSVSTSVATGTNVTNPNMLFQYTEVYQALMTTIFEYYDTWQARFYNSLKDNKDVTQEDIDGLYYAVKDLKAEVASFYTQKTLFEEEVKAFGTDSAIITASIEVFNYHYNKLVRQSFSFINTFIDMQNKYFPIDESQVYYASMIYHQSAVQLAQAMFTTNIESMESGEYCSIKNLAFTGENVNTNYTFEKYFLYGQPETLGVVEFTKEGDGIKVIDIALKPLKMIEGKVSLSESEVDQIKALAVMNKNFQQQKEMYSRACAGFPLYEYKCAIFKIEEYSTATATSSVKSLTTFLNNLSFENEARVRIINSFEVSTVIRFASTLHSLATGA